MVTLQKMPEELKAFIKQRELAWPKKSVGGYQAAAQAPLPDAVTCTLIAQARREMSISDSFESIPNGSTIMPKQSSVRLGKGLGCYYDTATAIVTAKKAGIKATPIGRLIVRSY